MTERLPIRARGHDLEALSRAHVEAIFSQAGWICRRLPEDYGLDMQVEVVSDRQVSGLFFWIQLKATDELETSSGDVLHRCKVSTAGYFLQQLEPVMYVVYDAQADAAYWLWVQPYLEGLDETGSQWRDQQTVQIRIPLANRLTADSIPLIEQHMHAWREHAAPQVGWTTPPTPQIAGPPFTLPPDLPTFTGREDLLTQLDRLLQPGSTTSVAIVGLKGMAGVGKSALAVHAAHAWRERFPDGVVWVDLQAEHDPRHALRYVATVYGSRDQAARLGDDRQALVALVRTLLQGKQALIVLDNAEDLPAADLDCLLPGVPGPVTVVTSRREFPSLERLGHTLRVDVMEMGEALALLGELLGQEWLRAEPAAGTEEEREPYERLAERLGRLPLALDIAGRLMAQRGWGPGKMIHRLEGAADLPAFLALPVAEKPEDSVARAFALSYEGLGEAERELFRALGVFAPAGFTAQAVAWMVGKEVETEAVLEELEGDARKKLQELLAAGAKVMKTDQAADQAALERLVALSLVRRAQTGAGARPARPQRSPGEPVEDRYDLHSLVRDYAQALARKAGEADRRAERHARYFTALADWGRQQLGNPETVLQAVGIAAAERGNLLAAQEASLRLGLWDEAVRLAYDLDDLFERSGHWADRRRVLEAGIGAAQEGGDRQQASLLALNLGVAYYNTGQNTRAREQYEASLRGLEEVGEEESVPHARAVYALAALAQDQGDYPEARRLYGEAAETFGELGAQREQATVLRNLGRLAQGQGNYPEARRLYGESLDIKRQLGDRAGVASSLHQLGNLAYVQGDYPEARRLYGESLDIKRQLGDRAGVALGQWGLGNVAQDQGDYEEAERQWRAALETFGDLGDRRNEAGVLHNLGALAQDQGDYPEARRLYGESLDIERQLGDRAGVAQTLHQLGMLAQQQGDYPEARRLYGESLDIERQLGDRAGVATTLHQLGRLAEVDGNLEKAQRLFAESLATFEELGSPNAEIARESLDRVRRKVDGRR